MHELIAADFLRGTAFTGLDATADGVLATLRRVHHSALPTTAGPSPSRRRRRSLGAKRRQPLARGLHCACMGSPAAWPHQLGGVSHTALVW